MPELNSPGCQPPKRILFLDHTAILGGGEIALLRLIKSLDRNRYEPIVVLGGDGELYSRLCANGIAATIIPLEESVAHVRKETLGVRSLLNVGKLVHFWRYSLQIARFIRSEQVVLVHTNSLKSDLFGGIAARLAGVPCVWHVRDRIAADYLPTMAATVFRRLCFYLPKRVVVNSNATAHCLEIATNPRTRARQSEHIKVIYDGVEAPDPLLPTRQRSNVVAMVGRISPWKGQHVFIDAAAKVREKYPNVCFHIVGTAMFGEEKYAEALQTQVTSAGLEDTVKFVGFQSDIPAYLRSADILVHASVLPEPFGQVVIEGMAAGIPVVATDGGAIPEIVSHGITGLLVPMGDADAMAMALCNLIADPEMSSNMGLAGYEKVNQRFLITRTADHVQQLYDTLLGPKAVATPSPSTRERGESA